MHARFAGSIIKNTCFSNVYQCISNSIQNFNIHFEKLIFYTNFNRFLIDYNFTKIFRYLDGNKIYKQILYL